MIDKVGFSLACLDELLLSLSGQEGDLHPPVYSPDGDMIGIVTQDPIIIGNGPMKLKLSLALPVKLISIGNLGYTTNDYLGRKWEALPHIMVGKLMKIELAKGLTIPGYPGNVIAGSIGLLHSLKEGLGLIRQRLKFNIRNKFHRLNSSVFNLICQV